MCAVTMNDVLNAGVFPSDDRVYVDQQRGGGKYSEVTAVSNADDALPRKL